MEVYQAQHRYFENHGSFSTSLGDLGVQGPADGGAVRDVKLQVTDVRLAVYLC
jgi:hypothetical protein